MTDLMLVLVRLLVFALMSAGPSLGGPLGWHYSDRVYGPDGKRPFNLERSQVILRQLVMSCGRQEPGYMETVLVIDAPRESPRVVLVAAPDSVWHALIPAEHWMPEERSYVAVVGGVAPDSIRVALVDGSRFSLKLEAKRK